MGRVRYTQRKDRWPSRTAWTSRPRFGFTLTVWVAFRLAKENGIGRQLDDVVRRTVELLDHVPGDAVLHFDYEVVWLVRRGGELSLNERDDIWTPTRLAAVGQRPHRRGTPAFS
jgi:hypothetical protein